MPNPTLSDIDFKNKMVLALTTLNFSEFILHIPFWSLTGKNHCIILDPSRKEEQKNRIKNRNQWIKSEQNGFTDERKTRPDYRPDLDPENPLYGTRIHQSPTKPLNSNKPTVPTPIQPRTTRTQPVPIQPREITSEVQNIAKIERIDDEEPSSQDSNLMSRNASTFIWPLLTMIWPHNLTSDFIRLSKFGNIEASKDFIQNW